MKGKVLNLLLIISSLFGYLEWGKENSSFLFQGEYELLKNMISDPKSAIHPFTLIPLLGQIILFITLFLKKTNRKLTYVGISCIGLLLLFMFFIGVISVNIKILISTLPFIVIAILTIINQRKVQNEN
jgi:cobalamin biosynthesis protein CobD/CbiB